MTTKDPKRPRFVKHGTATVFIPPCSVCGDMNAGHGVGFSYRDKKIGTWYCAKHYKELKEQGK